MDTTTFTADIPLDLARAAHAGTSFTPERRGEQEIASYCAQLASDYALLEKYANTDAKRATLDAEFARYRSGFRRRMLVYLGARGRCLSSMITGPSNFPTARNEKRNRSADTKLDDLVEFRKRALAAIRKTLTPELQPIMAGSSDAVERLQKEIAKLELMQSGMKQVNAAIRKHSKKGAAAQTAAVLAMAVRGDVALVLPGGPTTVARLLEPDFLGRVGFPDYALKNNGANIRRLRERLAAVTTAKATPATETVSESGVRFEDSPADNRVRLFFPGKPADDVRAQLKANGFRWTPSLGCWQAYRNHRALTHAAAVAGTEVTS